MITTKMHTQSSIVQDNILNQDAPTQLITILFQAHLSAKQIKFNPK